MKDATSVTCNHLEGHVILILILCQTALSQPIITVLLVQSTGTAVLLVNRLRLQVGE
jgi:hypothetical protein